MISGANRKLAIAAFAYALALGILLFGVLVNPHTWSAWWARNAGWLFNCQKGWSLGTKLIPIALIAIGFAATASIRSRAGTALRWLALPIVMSTAAAIGLTWPSPGCPPA